MINSKSPVLEIKNLTKAYEGTVAVSGFDFVLSLGEVRCLAGMNGSGKSTLIKCISGVETFETGQIFIEGQEINNVSVAKSMKLGIQVIHQDFALLPSLSVAENIMLPHYTMRNAKFISLKRIIKEAEEYLAKFNENIPVNACIEELSVAQKQLVAIIRALSLKVKILIMDEPTSALTNEEIDTLLESVRKISATGIAVIFVSHKLCEIKRSCDSITVIRNGIKVGDYNADDVDESTLAFHMTGRNININNKKKGPNNKDIVLQVENYNAKADHFHDINLKLQVGEILGIAGRLGAGRTEFALSLWGLNEKKNGTLLIDGKSVPIRQPSHAIEAGIGFIPEDRHTQALCLELPIIDNLNLEQLVVNNLKRLDEESSEIFDIIQRLSIKISDLQQPVSELSGGNQQKIVIAKWLLVHPKILILDNPTVGIDIAARMDVYAMLQAYSQQGMSFVVISDELTELISVCDRIAIMKNKTITQEFSVHDCNIEMLNEVI